MTSEKKLILCPDCRAKTNFVPICEQKTKGKEKSSIILGRYKCSECTWQSDLQELGHHPVTRSKNPVYLIQHYSKEDKRLFIWVYTTEKRVKDPSENNDPNLDHHLLTVEVTPNSLNICPNVPFSVQSKRIEEGLMFIEENKELIASVCSKCSAEEKMACLYKKGSCKNIEKGA